MTNDAQSQEAISYASAVRAALADLPTDERSVLLEDLDEHLAEVAAEGPGSLADKLGSPEAYAAELRQAYGATAAGTPAGGWRRRANPLVLAGRALSASALVRELRTFVPELRPAWWLVRAYLAVLLIILIFEGRDHVVLLPNPFSRRGLLQATATVLAMLASVWLGRRMTRDTRRVSTRALVAALNVALFLVSLPVDIALGRAATLAPQTAADYQQPASIAYAVSPTNPVLNIYPYSRDGKALADVLLYDQDGNPIQVGGKGVAMVQNVPQDANGQPITNAFPLQERQFDGTPLAPPRVALPVWPSPSPAPAAGPSPKH